MKNKALEFAEGEVLISTYRPFSKQWLYYGRRLNEVTSTNAADFSEYNGGESG